MYFDLPTAGLPSGWASRDPDERDIADLALLRAAVTRAATGSGAPNVDAVQAEITDVGSWTRRQVVLADERDRVRAWASAHDRAAGRTLLHVTIDPELEDSVADPLAAILFRWCEDAAKSFDTLRRADETQLDTGSYEGDDRQRRWLEAAGFSCTRRWLNMTRPVGEDEKTFPELQDGVTIRRVRRRVNGNPLAVDVQAVHWVLETSFEDHFNAYRETFSEFVHRLMEDPGHAWDQWWLATVRDEFGVERPAGAVVCTMLPPDAGHTYGSYIEYIGVHRDARGRGIAKGLLRTVVADTAKRGRNRVGLEVDAESPTGADGLYRSMGWETSYVTESWHRDVNF
ncbi:GNAT family N-acetyltransferase [Mobilicoccus pelagius]|uniref:Putative acetyltransferase n=1 Tax=Mobilicoccus pelagius NBRC 104925 TaxID=1089455 RepID=H5USQ7_9MICO|nr:GNAT family N-acetyltransferase [Mobilicoccus pelagius]GAB48765.1 putative acetyltransferase [Mobilicoccus pelagius NBRC 104925]